MTVSIEDRLAIQELIARHGHLMDDGAFDRLDELFTADVVYDLTAFGSAELHGPVAIAAAARALGDGNPVAHHVTNVLITVGPDGVVSARSKGLGVRRDGTLGSVGYERRAAPYGRGLAHHVPEGCAPMRAQPSDRAAGR